MFYNHALLGAFFVIEKSSRNLREPSFEALMAMESWRRSIKASYLICFAITRPRGGQGARVQGKARAFQGTDCLLHRKQGSLNVDKVEYFPVLDARPHLAATQLHTLQPPHQPLETIGHVEELRWNKIIDFSFMIKQSRC